MEECAKLCLEKEGCNYFIVGNGFTNDGIDKTGSCGDLADKSEDITFFCVVSLLLAIVSNIGMYLYARMDAGHCYWEKTSNGCKDQSEDFEFDAYDFYALCRPGIEPEAEFQCHGEPAKITAGKCRARQTRSITSTKYCEICEQGMCRYVLRNFGCFHIITAWKILMPPACACRGICSFERKCTVLWVRSGACFRVRTHEPYDTCIGRRRPQTVVANAMHCLLCRDRVEVSSRINYDYVFSQQNLHGGGMREAVLR